MPIPFARGGILQDFRPLRLFVRIDDPLWPVVRETSRQLLRSGNIHLELLPEFQKDIEEILLEISDYQPAKTQFPSFRTTSRNDVCMYERDQDDGSLHLIAYIGMKEPEPDVRWIKMPVHDGWKEVVLASRELHEAGYPGCIGCGGPNSESPWDEEISRSRLE